MDINLVSQDGVNWHELPTTLQENRNTAFFYNNRFYTLGNNGSLWKSELVGSAEEGWAKWQRYFSLNLSINRDDGEDQDCDGIENIMEYALGTDPGDPTSVPVVMASKDGSGCLEITIPRSYNALDLDYIVEQSTGLGGGAVWTALETEPVSETNTELVVRTKQPLSSISPQFLRLRIEFAPVVP